jgi:hypothetical protein
VPGCLVLRIVDKDGYADGTFAALEGGPDGASCVPTPESPQVALPASVPGFGLPRRILGGPVRRLGLVDGFVPRGGGAGR